jgi:thiamine transport system permease protein
LVGDAYGLAHWRSVGSVAEGTGLRISPVGSVRASLQAAIPAVVAALALGIPAARAVSGRPNGLGARVLLLPLAVSATTVGLGLVLLSTRGPIDLRRSGALVVLAQTLVALPVVVRSVAPAMRAVPDSLRGAAELSGASWMKRTFRVEVPLVRPAVVAAAGLATVIALGEFGATVFVARLGESTVPVAIERLMSRPGQAGLGQAMVLACVLAVVCSIVIWAIDAVSGSDAGVSLGD